MARPRTPIETRNEVEKMLAAGITPKRIRELTKIGLTVIYELKRKVDDARSGDGVPGGAA